MNKDKRKKQEQRIKKEELELRKNKKELSELKKTGKKKKEYEGREKIGSWVVIFFAFLGRVDMLWTSCLK